MSNKKKAPITKDGKQEVVINIGDLTKNKVEQEDIREINEIIEELDQNAAELEKCNNEEERHLEKFKDKLNTYKKNIKRLGIEIRSVSGVKKEELDIIRKKHFDNCNRLLIDEKFTKLPPVKKTIDTMTSDEIIHVAKKIQEDDLNRLDNMITQVEEMKEIGINTTQKLQQQTEQLKKIDSDVQDVQTNLKLSAKQMRSYIRRLATDKIILTFIFFIIVGIIVIILLKTKVIKT